MTSATPASKSEGAGDAVELRNMAEANVWDLLMDFPDTSNIHVRTMDEIRTIDIQVPNEMVMSVLHHLPQSMVVSGRIWLIQVHGSVRPNVETISESEIPKHKKKWCC